MLYSLRSAGRFAVITSVVTLLGLTLACSNGDAGGEDGGTAPANGSSSSTEEAEFTIEFKDNVFEPTEFTVKAGTTVEFKYSNTGLAVHNMVIQSGDTEGQTFQSPAAVNPGGEGEFTATFTKPGKVHFICAYHFPGMEGDITVQ